MEIQKSYKVEIYPTKTQIEYFNKAFGISRFSYNWALNYNKTCYEEDKELPKEEKRDLRYYSVRNYFNSIKKEQFPFVLEVGHNVVTSAINETDIAFKNFFRRIKKHETPGFPRFKSKKFAKQSFYSDKPYVTASTTKVPKIGYIKLSRSNFIPKQSETVKYNYSKISKDGNKYFISISTTQNIIENKEPINNYIGIDVGIKELITCSDGQVFHNKKFLKSEEKKQARLQRRLSRKRFYKDEEMTEILPIVDNNKKIKKYPSKNRIKAQTKLNKFHKKIRNRKQFYLHNITSQLVKTKPTVFFVENLNVKGMVKNHNLAGSISDCSFSEIKNLLEYKTKWYGGRVVEVNRYFPSSKTCSNCGNKKEELKLSERTYICEKCGLEIDRDFNAAINIRNEGLKMLNDTSTADSAGINAHGKNVNLELPMDSSCLDEVRKKKSV